MIVIAAIGVCAMLENTANNIQVSKRVEYFQNHQALDQAYEFRLRWVAGSKN